MAISPLKLPTLPANLPIVDSNGVATVAFSIFWQSAVQAIEASVNAVIAAQNAADAANAAAAAANAAASNAQTSANNAQTAADNTNQQQKLINSYITPDTVLTASPTTITIASHVRHYADGTSVSVTGETIAATAPGDTDYISYSDPTFAGGAVTYMVSTTQPTQIGATHVVGAIMIPTTGTANGGQGPLRPGQVEP